jgi:hypothetical protein
MENKKSDFDRKLLLLGTPIIAGHFLVVVWHLILVVKIQPNFPRLAVPFLILANLLPLAGLIAFAKGHRKAAGVLMVVPLGFALVIGLYQHFLGAGADNVFHMPAGDLRLPFQASAVLLILLEGLGCFVGFRIFATLIDHQEFYAK